MPVARGAAGRTAAGLPVALPVAARWAHGGSAGLLLQPSASVDNPDRSGSGRLQCTRRSVTFYTIGISQYLNMAECSQQGCAVLAACPSQHLMRRPQQQDPCRIKRSTKLRTPRRCPIMPHVHVNSRDCCPNSAAQLGLAEHYKRCRKGLTFVRPPPVPPPAPAPPAGGTGAAGVLVAESAAGAAGAAAASVA